MGLPVFHFRIQCVSEPVQRFAESILTLLQQKKIEIDYKLIQDIYEDDGRGNIRDFIYAEYSAPVEHSVRKPAVEIIYDRKSLSVVNFRFYATDILCEQKPFHDDQPLRFVGESTNWYRLHAEPAPAERILRHIITRLEKCGLEGYKTEEESKLDETRLRCILAGNDPALVMLRFSRVQYDHGFEKAMAYLDSAIEQLPEFAGPLSRTRATVLQYKKGAGPR